jgi:hypothetical protein
MSEPKAEQPESCPTSKSGIEGPGGYNSKDPSDISAPVKSYPGSGKLGGKTGGIIVGPASKK